MQNSRFAIILEQHIVWTFLFFYCKIHFLSSLFSLTQCFYLSSLSKAVTVSSLPPVPLPKICPQIISLLLTLLSPDPLSLVTGQMLQFNALIWLSVSRSISLILVHLVSPKTLWSNLGELAFAQTERGLWSVSPRCCFSAFACLEGACRFLILRFVECTQTHAQSHTRTTKYKLHM